MTKLIYLILLVVCCLVTSETTEIKDLQIDELVKSVNALKQAVDDSAKEQWGALQSLRFHLISTRSGLKQAIEDIKNLKKDLANCEAIRSDHAILPEEKITSTTSLPSITTS